MLADVVMDFARGIQAVDSQAPVASNSRTGVSYQPGIGPHAEAQTIKLVMAHLADADPRRYASYWLGVPYADGTRQACDVCLDGPEPLGMGDRSQNAAAYGRQRQAERQHGNTYPVALPCSPKRADRLRQARGIAAGNP